MSAITAVRPASNLTDITLWYKRDARSSLIRIQEVYKNILKLESKAKNAPLTTRDINYMSSMIATATDLWFSDLFYAKYVTPFFEKTTEKNVPKVSKVECRKDATILSFPNSIYGIEVDYSDPNEFAFLGTFNNKELVVPGYSAVNSKAIDCYAVEIRSTSHLPDGLVVPTGHAMSNNKELAAVLAFCRLLINMYTLALQNKSGYPTYNPTHSRNDVSKMHLEKFCRDTQIAPTMVSLADFHKSKSAYTGRVTSSKSDHISDTPKVEQPRNDYTGINATGSMVNYLKYVFEAENKKAKEKESEPSVFSIVKAMEFESIAVKMGIEVLREKNVLIFGFTKPDNTFHATNKMVC